MWIYKFTKLCTYLNGMKSYLQYSFDEKTVCSTYTYLTLEIHNESSLLILQDCYYATVLKIHHCTFQVTLAHELFTQKCPFVFRFMHKQDTLTGIVVSSHRNTAVEVSKQVCTLNLCSWNLCKILIIVSLFLSNKLYDTCHYGWTKSLFFFPF